MVELCNIQIIRMHLYQNEVDGPEYYGIMTTLTAEEASGQPSILKWTDHWKIIRRHLLGWLNYELSYD